MRYPYSCCIGTLFLLLTLSCVLLAACGQTPEFPTVTTGNTTQPPLTGTVVTPELTTSPKTTTSVTANETTAQTSAATTSAPQFVCDPQGKIAAVTVSTPEEWNAFAAAFNAEPERFADFVDVEITALLSFEDTIFICLLEPFSGRIYGKAVEPSEGDTLYVLETDPLIVDYRSSPYGRYSVDSGLTCGFTEIWKIEGGSLFGCGCEDSILVIENLLFSDIGYKNTSYIWGPGENDAIGNFFAMLCPKCFKIVPVGEYAGQLKYWPWFWMIVPAYILVTPLSFGLSMIFDAKSLKKDIKKLFKKEKEKV